MKYNALLAVLAISVLSIACSENRTTKSGIIVNIVEKGDGPELKDSTILQLNMKYLNDKGNEQWSSAKAGGPVPIQYIKEVWATSGTMYEALEIMKVGDSATFEVSAKDLYENTFKTAVPDSLDTASNVTFYAKIVSMMTTEEFQAFQKEEYEKAQAKAQEERVAAQAKMIEDAAEVIKKDGEIIDQYLADNGITAQTTESGLRYVITEEGEGENAQAGNQVSVHYNGTLLDGTKFDSSYDRGSPFGFVLGQGRVIMGWDEGIALLNKGAKATLYIPSTLAYGERAAGSIPANSILKFDVELVDFQ
ncbi:FKBP-type peptidyl-prolyl cis-trans isomerase [Reichenbachiella carrageenanivorans]|uniref:Peptidyl-prolyl cis-trans isomerase n=1 Tax=Reichenbachiella carrageenanivorans TaxID=2979869 RepID=A0ABY6D0Q9_9BACT|nr:FKBP-type peptidyl-prolyl cis-trans isomerase [Reichenbachiella carrageenanivorans]UXX79757.1 FKBP-type peptidyl-prolyl cis-trans isomerase [Reichenbachiella carrageenanivorans]